MKGKVSQVLLFSLMSFFGLSQPSAPPPAVYAKEELRPLIDSLVELCDYEGAFLEFKDSIIVEFARNNVWGDQLTQQANESIIYRYANNHMYYNVYAFTSENELLELIRHYNSLSRQEIEANYRKLDRMAIHNIENSIIQSCRYLDGKKD